MQKRIFFFLIFSSILLSFFTFAKHQKPFRVVGYFCSQTVAPDSFEVEKLTHIIFCFGSLKENNFSIHNSKDSAIIQEIVGLKKRNRTLKVMLSLGGWSGCKTCSDVFNTTKGRADFAKSLKEISGFFKTDGLDLDWEYPAIKGFPTHTFRKEDKHNFTLLVKEIRKTMGRNFLISFAAGGFTNYIDSSIEWTEIKNAVDFINVMSYDLVHGYSKNSGHHTPLFSTPQQIESTDHAVKMLLSKNIPADKIVIGAAFYGRLFQAESGFPVDLYEPAHFKDMVGYNDYENIISSKKGFVKRWDNIAQAPYAINEKQKIIFTFEDERSVELKTKYAIHEKLGGIMFWQLQGDNFHDGMLNAIDKTLKDVK